MICATTLDSQDVVVLLSEIRNEMQAGFRAVHERIDNLHRLVDDRDGRFDDRMVAIERSLRGVQAALRDLGTKMLNPMLELPEWERMLSP
jgi:uncharacterized protein YydD (DUF2326 family)